MLASDINLTSYIIYNSLLCFSQMNIPSALEGVHIAEIPLQKRLAYITTIYGSRGCVKWLLTGLCYTFTRELRFTK